TQVLARGGADVIVEWMPAALVARERGLPLVNIAQPFKSSGMMLTCLEESGIRNPETDLAGRTLGVWLSGNEYPFLAWMSRLGLSTKDEPGSVTLLEQGFNVDALLQKRAACISAMSYNEYWQIMDAGLSEKDLVTFKYQDQGIATLEDGIYVLETALQDDAKVDSLTRFVRASMRGWDHALAHPEEAAAIIIDNDKTGTQTLDHQIRMMTEIAKLLEGSDGRLDVSDYQRTVDILLDGGPDPILSAVPDGAYTSKVTDRAFD
ncbi:MAG: ABC transporter substrate-binding protein, partial [Paracoccus sp. (in: a-proteobacteria)]|nr:ABC transporter substrate-binding protein [Paracoccus sp. (in: a-proteobacteria)]